MRTVKGILFDYGGTIDTNGIHWGEFIWEEYRNTGMPITKKQFRNAYIHGERTLAKERIIMPDDTVHTLIRKKTAIQFDYLSGQNTTKAICMENAMKIADGCYSKVKSTLETTRNVIETLHSRFPMVLVTNFYGNMPTVLKEFGLTGYFKDIVESSVVGIRKPDPALFALGIESLGTTATETLVVGDSYRKDIYPSCTLGCTTAWLKKKCWEEEYEEAGHNPSFIIGSLEELTDIIGQIK